jgi:hypothetical protein
VADTVSIGERRRGEASVQLLSLLAFIELLGLTLALLRWRAGPVIALAWLAYGALAGALTIRWRAMGGESYPPNLLGQALAEQVHEWAFRRFADPHAIRAEDTMPWLLRRSQLYLLASALLWGLIGLLLWPLADRPRPRRRRQTSSRD